jgi:ketopantoate reductase
MNGIPWWFARELPLPLSSPVLEAIDPGAVLGTTLRTGQLVSAVVQSSNEVIAPGVVLNTTPKRNRMMLARVERDAPGSLEDIVELLRGAGYEALESADIRAEIWRKMALWVAVSPMAALTGSPLDRLCADPGSFRAMCGVMSDMLALGERLGFASDGAVEEKIGFYRDKPTRPSLLKDVELGRVPELASCVTIFEALAQALGEPTPYLATIATLARMRFAPGTPV